MSARFGVKAGVFDVTDDRAEGVYCADCAKPLEMIDLEALGLVDTRLLVVAPNEFDAEAVAQELRDALPDAEWSRLDLPARAAQHGHMPAGLHPALTAALARTGRDNLFVHQSFAIDAGLAGRNTIQATGTGSGKSLGLMLPVLDRLLREPEATAIAAYPLRALANDQFEAIRRLALHVTFDDESDAVTLHFGDDLPSVVVCRQDGKTAEDTRRVARASARLLITTPDSVHATVVGRARHKYKDGTSWQRLLGNLVAVVLDEVHAYTGVFGSHAALVVRRLRRAAAFYGADPQFLMASATIGNPVEHAQALTGCDDVELVDDDGSPQAHRIVLICNPPLIASALPGAQSRQAPQTIAIEAIADVFANSAAHPPVRSIAFSRSRSEVATLRKRVRGRLEGAKRKDLAKGVAMYTGTLSSDERTKEEGKLRDGSTIAISSTSALELGIDIPELSVALLVGYPGSTSSFRQRAGRAGRAGEGLVVLVVGSDPLQQYMARSPEALQALLRGTPEDVVINAEAPVVLEGTGLQAAHRDLGGLSPDDAAWFGAAVDDALGAASGPPAFTHRDSDYWDLGWDGSRVSENIRAMQGVQYTLLDGDDLEIGSIDSQTAGRDAHVGAVWETNAGMYLVKRIDRDSHTIRCSGPAELDYVTRATGYVRVDCLATHESTSSRLGDLAFNDLVITRGITDYYKIPLGGGAPSKYKIPNPKIMVPPLNTDGFALRLAEGVAANAQAAMEHVLLAVAPVVVKCEPNDLDATSDGTVIYLYDTAGAGMGYACTVFHRFEEVATLAHEIVSTCPCDDGCPSCVWLGRRPDGNADVSRLAALAVFDAAGFAR
jgi:DEAD/DEAH box helicase domain-containing protein